MTDAREPAGEAVERVARAMAESAGFAWEACAQEQWRRDARAGLAALPPAPASASARALREILAAIECCEIASVLETLVSSWHSRPGYDRHHRELGCKPETTCGAVYQFADLMAQARAALASAAPEQAGEFARGVEAAAKWLEALYPVREFARAIRALAREPETQGWRPIETAPHMQTILLFAVTDVGPNGEVRNWKMESGFWHEGYDAWRWGGHICAPYETAPTHWQPLPAPPASAARAKEET